MYEYEKLQKFQKILVQQDVCKLLTAKISDTFVKKIYFIIVGYTDYTVLIVYTVTKKTQFAYFWEKVIDIAKIPNDFNSARGQLLTVKISDTILLQF